MAKNRSGKELELRVAEAYREMGAKKVEHDVELAGNQIDVYVELEAKGHLHRIAVEAKDQARPVGVKVVNGFAEIVGILRGNREIDEGVIVSASGFSKQARKAAKPHGITLLVPADLDAIVAGSMSPQRPAEAAPSVVSSHVISFDTFMDDRTRGFVGRQFAFEAVDRFLSDPSIPSGYFFIRSDPGVGKSALIAQLIRKRNLPVYHFNIALQSINTPRQFMGNVCERLIRHFDLAYSQFPEDFEKSGMFLSKLLQEANARLGDDEKLVIAIDALDEVNAVEGPRANPLFLPPALPAGIYVVMTARRTEALALPFSNIVEWELNSGSESNQQDIRTFLQVQAELKGIRAWMKREKLNRDGFVAEMVEKSEGNFMYLHHVLLAIAGGWLAGFAVADLPHGLRAYYRQHWEQMCDHDLQAFEKLYEPVVCALGAAQEAVQVDLVAEWTKLKPKQVRHVFKEWITFLHVEVRPDGEKRYRIYHTAFRDFLQEEVDPGLRTYHTLIADSALEKVRRRKAELGL